MSRRVPLLFPVILPQRHASIYTAIDNPKTASMSRRGGPCCVLRSSPVYSHCPAPFLLRMGRSTVKGGGLVLSAGMRLAVTCLLYICSMVMLPLLHTHSAT